MSKRPEINEPKWDVKHKESDFLSPEMMLIAGFEIRQRACETLDQAMLRTVQENRTDRSVRIGVKKLIGILKTRREKMV